MDLKIEFQLSEKNWRLFFDGFGTYMISVPNRIRDIISRIYFDAKMDKISSNVERFDANVYDNRVLCLSLGKCLEQ